MRKKIVVTVAAVAMAAVMSVSAFAAEGTAVPSISGDGNTTFSAPSSADASEETKKVYEAIASVKKAAVVTTETGETETATVSTAEQIAAVIMVTDTKKQQSPEAQKQAQAQAVAIVENAAKVVGVEKAEDVVIRTYGDIKVQKGEASMTVAGMEESEKAVVMYMDENGAWQTTEAVVVNGKLVFRLPYNTTVMLLTKNKAKKAPVAPAAPAAAQ